MKSKRVIYKGKKPLGPSMGIRLYNQHYQALMKRVRAGEGSYQHLVREIVDAYFKQQKREAKQPVAQEAENSIQVLSERLDRIERMCVTLGSPCSE